MSPRARSLCQSLCQRNIDTCLPCFVLLCFGFALALLCFTLRCLSLRAMWSVRKQSDTPGNAVSSKGLEQVAESLKTFTLVAGNAPEEFCFSLRLLRMRLRGKQLQRLPQLTPFAPLSHVKGDLDETCLTISSLPLPKGFRCRCSRYCVQFKGSHPLVPLSSLFPSD